MLGVKTHNSKWLLQKCRQKNKNAKTNVINEVFEWMNKYAFFMCLNEPSDHVCVQSLGFEHNLGCNLYCQDICAVPA